MIKNKKTFGEEFVTIIQNDEEKLWKIEFFKDELLMQIFLSVLDDSKSPRQISQECNIPIDDVYEKLKKLEQKGLLESI